MRRAVAVEQIRAAARERRLVFTEHAYEKMDILGETERSVGLAIASAKTFAAQEDGAWRAVGNGLTCVVAIRGDVIVVTMFV